MKQRILFRTGALLLVMIALFGIGLSQDTRVFAAPAAAPLATTLPTNSCTATGPTARICDLWAMTGTVALPGGVTMPIWGYTSAVTGTAQLPGPALIVNQGETVTVTLHNNLVETTTLLFQGQSMVPDRVGVGTGAAKSYTFIASQAGTYLYEAGLLANGQHQVALGLYGALIVRPAIINQAYVAPTTVYTDEAQIVLSEIDPALNTSATPATFDLRNYAPKYWLINGQAYSNTVNISTTAGSRVLLRYVNAGLQHHSMALLGLNQTVIAQDGSLLTNAHKMVAETIAPGETADVITTVPTTTVAGSKFALYDGNLGLNNNGTTNFGGMLTFLAIPTGVPGADTVGPTTSAVALNLGTGLLSATVSDVATGNANVTAAEYFTDTVRANGTGAAMTGAYGTPTVNVQATIPAAILAALSSGSHTIYVHGQDAAGNWGPFSSVVLNVDNAGPATTGLTLSPNPSNGTVAVSLIATANDSATGNSNVTDAEYFINATSADGSGIHIVPNAVAPVASLQATIAAATIAPMLPGPHPVFVHSKDAAKHWGPFIQLNLLVDKVGPTTSTVSASPNPNNGSVGLSSTQLVVRVSAKFDDASVGAAAFTNADVSAATHIFLPLVQVGVANVADNQVAAAAIIPGTSYVKAAEGFIDVAGVTGTGFLFAASDGLFDSLSELGYADVPLTTISRLTAGNHTIYVHAQDGAGNWGPTSTMIFVIDRTGPTVTTITLTPSTVNNTAVAISAAASDVATGNSNIASGEYFIDNITGANGTGTAMTAAAAAPATTVNAVIPAATVAALSAGTHTISVRAKDALGNWGVLVSTNLLIDRVGPTVSAATLTPSTASNTAVAISAAASDVATGNSNIGAGEYFIDVTGANGTGGAMTAAAALPATTINGVIPAATIAALSAGTHTIRVHAQDALGNWGAIVSTNLLIDRTGPTTSAATLMPNISSNTAVAISAAASDVATGNSNIGAGEYFIDTPAGVNGTGGAMTAAAALPATTINGVIPAATVAALTAGTHTITVHARDVLGNWGAFVSVNLRIDRTAPTFTSITLNPASIAQGTATVNLTVNGATDPLVGGFASGVTGGEYWFGATNIPAGTGTAFTGLTSSIATNALAAGANTVRVRIHDAVGNWSVVNTATLTVIPDAIFADGFEVPITLPGNWTSVSTATATRLSNTTTAALVGVRGLQAQGNNTNYVQYDFGTVANPAAATFDARFYFNPNSNTGTNQDILVARTTGGTTVFRVRYRLNAGLRQVQIQVGTGTANAAWTTITNGASNRIEVVWQSGSTLQLFVGTNTTAAQSLTAGANTVGSVRMGSVISGGNATLEYFDAFSSKRSTTPFGP